MVVKSFIKAIQDYYGMEYRKGLQLDLIADYLKEKSESYLTCLFSVTVKDFSGQYKSLPDIAVFERLAGDTHDAVALMKRKQDLSTPAIKEKGVEDYREEIIKLFDKLYENAKWYHKKGDKIEREAKNNT